MVDELEVNGGKLLVQYLLHVVNLESWQERTGVVNSLNKGVDSVTVGLDACHNNRTILIPENLGCLVADCASLNGLSIYASSVVDCEGNILDSITMSLELLCKLSIAWVEGRCNGENNLAVADNVSAVIS